MNFPALHRHLLLSLGYSEVAPFSVDTELCEHIKHLTYITIVVYICLPCYTMTADRVSHSSLYYQHLAGTVPLGCSLYFFLLLNMYLDQTHILGYTLRYLIGTNSE